MTCEVAVANKLAVALAADSAVTFSGEGTQNTYASGANKIFQLAFSEPVAVMIYNNAVIADVHWEVIIKAYREELAEKYFDRLLGYGEDLVRFLNECTDDLIPLNRKMESTIHIYIMGVRYVLGRVLASQPTLQAEGISDADAAQLWRLGMVEFMQSASSAEFCGGMSQADLDAAQAHAPALQPLVANIFGSDTLKKLLVHVDVAEMATAGIVAAFKYGTKIMERTFTGVVIAGFGKKDFLPGYIDFKFYGYLAGKVLCSVAKKRSVDHNGNNSIIEAFARRAMVETFTQGASPEVWTAVGKAFDTFAAKVCHSAAQKSGQTLTEEAVRQAIIDHQVEFRKNWSFSVFDGHLKPLYRVVIGLSVEELAELAETLVLLESLKEKVTHRTQSVGGPIDVAVITKAEGLVWIKRKLYFEPHLNHRFFHRMDRIKGERHGS